MSSTPTTPTPPVTLSLTLTAAQHTALETARVAIHTNPVVVLPVYASDVTFAEALLAGTAQAQASGMGALLTQLLVMGVKPPSPPSPPKPGAKHPKLPVKKK